MTTVQLTHEKTPDWVGTEVSSACPFNLDQTKILLVNKDRFVLCSLDGAYYRLPIAAAQEPRWSRTEPNIIYYVTDSRFGTRAQLMRFDYATGMSSVVTTFPYSTISGKGESDICRDGDHFVFIGDDKEIVLYSLKNGVEGKYTHHEPIDGLKITPKGKILVSGGSGLYIYPGGVRVTTANGHAAVTSYKGHDILLWCSAADAKINQNAVMMIDLDKTGSPVALLNLPWTYAMHVSVCDRDFALVSAYSKMDPTFPHYLYKVYFDWTAPLFLGETGGRYDTTDDVKGYTSQPKAAFSRDGSMAVYSVFDGSTTNAWLMKIDDTQPQPVPVKPSPTPVQLDIASMLTLANIKEIDFTKDEGRQWIWYFKVVGGKMTVKVYDI